MNTKYLINKLTGRTKHEEEQSQAPAPETKPAKRNIPLEEEANAVMDDPAFINYLQHHGYHFTDKLANWASSKMVNTNGSRSHWSVDECMEMAKKLNISIPSSSTRGDFSYTMNMAYADFMPIILSTAEDCAKYSSAVMHDEDGYEGIQFSRWLSDVIHKRMIVPWGNVI